MTFDFDPAQWGWDHSEYSARAVGDSGPWVSWLPRAWHAVADPSGSHPVPPPPSARMPSYGSMAITRTVLRGGRRFCTCCRSEAVGSGRISDGEMAPAGLPDEDPLCVSSPGGGDPTCLMCLHGQARGRLCITLPRR